MDIKSNKYNCRDEVSFERSKLFGNSLIRGIVISYKFLNYNWLYLVECFDDKKLVVVAENDLWLLKSDENGRS